MKRICLVELVCPHYRISLWRKIAQRVDFTLIFGEGDKKGAWSNASDLAGFKYLKLKSWIIRKEIGGVIHRLVYFPGLLKAVKSLNPEVIISEGFTNILNNIFLLIYCKFHSLPLVIWDSGRKLNKPKGVIRVLLEPLDAFILKHVEAIIVYGSGAKEYFIHLGILPEKIFIAQNTIDVEEFIRKKILLEKEPSKIDEIIKKYGLLDKRVLLYVGALERRKKVNELVVVYKDLLSRFPDLALMLVGDGELKEELDQFIKKNGLNNCHLLGKIIEEVSSYFSLCDIFVLPGQGGLAINQAMAFAKPCIVGEGDGTEIDLVKNGETGFIITDTKSLKASIECILEDEPLRRRMGENCFALIKKYTQENMVDVILRAASSADKDFNVK